MDCVPGPEKQRKLLTEILSFIRMTKGLRETQVTDNRIRVQQSVDGKFIEFDLDTLVDVLVRSDVSGEEFIQVNFRSGQKILLTSTLIGFKPTAQKGLDSARIPRVVTTPDIVSVFEAIQDVLHTSGTESHEMAILKKVYEAVLAGGESVGFDLSTERSWLVRIPSSSAKLPS